MLLVVERYRLNGFNKICTCTYLKLIEIPLYAILVMGIGQTGLKIPFYARWASLLKKAKFLSMPSWHYF